MDEIEELIQYFNAHVSKNDLKRLIELVENEQIKNQIDHLKRKPYSSGAAPRVSQKIDWEKL